MIARRHVCSHRELSILALRKFHDSKLPKAEPALLILKRGRNYFTRDYLRYEAIDIPCACGDFVKPIPGARCVTCRAEVQRIVDDEVLREVAAECREINARYRPSEND